MDGARDGHISVLLDLGVDVEWSDGRIGCLLNAVSCRELLRLATMRDELFSELH